MFQFLTNLGGRKADGARHASKGTQRASFRPQLDSLEDRLLLSAAPPIGSVSLSPTGVLSIAAYNTPRAPEVDVYVNIVTVNRVVYIGGRPTIVAVKEVEVSLDDLGGYSPNITAEYNLQSVTSIAFYGYDASNFFTNDTSINSEAHGYGTFNSFTGGSGHDTFYGNAGGGFTYNVFNNSPNGVDTDYGGVGSSNIYDVYFKRIGFKRDGVFLEPIYEQLTFVHNFNPSTDVIHDIYEN